MGLSSCAEWDDDFTQFPDSADAIYLHGISALVAGKDEDADRILREALAKAPESVRVRVALAKARR